MKKLIFSTLIGVSLFTVSPVYAHTGLTSSTPLADEVITEEVTEVTLTFHGTIQAMSTMTLKNETKELPFEEIQVQDNVLIGTLATPLENDSYTVTWNIVGEDGHPITGDIPFAVQMEKKVSSDNPVVTAESNDETTKEEVKEEIKEEIKEEKKGATTSIALTATFLLLAVVASTMFALRKKK